MGETVRLGEMVEPEFVAVTLRLRAPVDALVWAERAAAEDARLVR
jgi:hypothetical protein